MDEDDIYCYHGTLLGFLPYIFATGVRGGSSWGSRELASYHIARRFPHFLASKVLIRKPLGDFDASRLGVDRSMTETPFYRPTTGGEDEQARAVEAAWEASEGEWRDCWAIYQSMIYWEDMPVKAKDIILLQSVTLPKVSPLMETMGVERESL
jgi:hypothetical protein